MQRLVLKEKQVVELQRELQKYVTQNPVEDREAVSIDPAFALLSNIEQRTANLQEEQAKRERDRAKWNSVMEEMAKLKIQVGTPHDKLVTNHSR